MREVDDIDVPEIIRREEEWKVYKNELIDPASIKKWFVHDDLNGLMI